MQRARRVRRRQLRKPGRRQRPGRRQLRQQLQQRRRLQQPTNAELPAERRLGRKQQQPEQLFAARGERRQRRLRGRREFSSFGAGRNCCCRTAKN